jgi:hypothetical protein
MIGTSIDAAVGLQIHYRYLCMPLTLANMNTLRYCIANSGRILKLLVFWYSCSSSLAFQYFDYDPEEFEDTKGAIRIRMSKKNRKHNGQKKKAQKDKQRSTKHTYKAKDRVTRTPLKRSGGYYYIKASCAQKIDVSRYISHSP